MLKEYIQIFKIISKSEEKVKSLKAMELDFKNTDEGVKKAWFDYKQIVGYELLSKMPIKHLNDVETGMPIETLINNGLNYVGDCSYKSQEYFEQFSGIGNVKSRRIVVAVEALMRATFDELDFKIKGNRQSEELLKALYKHMQYKHNEKEIIQFENNRNKLIQGTKKSLSLARKNIDW